MISLAFVGTAIISWTGAPIWTLVIPNVLAGISGSV
jgi:hypothetical protein